MNSEGVSNGVTERQLNAFGHCLKTNNGEDETIQSKKNNRGKYIVNIFLALFR